MTGPTPKEGDLVVLRAFDDVPEHHFLIQDVHDDCITGHATTGPLTGEYGEPDIDLILRIVD